VDGCANFCSTPEKIMFWAAPTPEESQGALRYSRNLPNTPKESQDVRGWPFESMNWALATIAMTAIGKQSGAAAKPAKANMGELESMVDDSPSSDRACLKLAQILNVRRNEVALLRIDKGSLRFVYPPELRSAGVLPLSGSAVAARTATTKAPVLSNSFMRVKHVSLFEAVKLGAEVEDRSLEQMPIQKIISVPIVLTDGNVMGVVQVSRKGLDPAVAGADFTNEDLKQLERMAEILGRMPFMREGADF
jgi:hypothetical protein